eukprot:TRINITY_DN2874_c0_g5_i2.p1 TRINITY_DN2874_c0_g5~~TRINITY_DN2874_c0_g5_i2.p1  ORF type:complete len:456 (+),score=27.34 TRINITY_DN2874_c0_g5_i2:68-1435(+)
MAEAAMRSVVGNLPGRKGDGDESCLAGVGGIHNTHSGANADAAGTGEVPSALLRLVAEGAALVARLSAAEGRASDDQDLTCAAHHPGQAPRVYSHSPYSAYCAISGCGAYEGTMLLLDPLTETEEDRRCHQAARERRLRRDQDKDKDKAYTKSTKRNMLRRNQKLFENVHTTDVTAFYAEHFAVAPVKGRGSARWLSWIGCGPAVRTSTSPSGDACPLGDDEEVPSTEMKKEVAALVHRVMIGDEAEDAEAMPARDMLKKDMVRRKKPLQHDGKLSLEDGLVRLRYMIDGLLRPDLSKRLVVTPEGSTSITATILAAVRENISNHPTGAFVGDVDGFTSEFVPAAGDSVVWGHELFDLSQQPYEAPPALPRPRQFGEVKAHRGVDPAPNADMPRNPVLPLHAGLRHPQYPPSAHLLAAINTFVNPNISNIPAEVPAGHLENFSKIDRVHSLAGPR